MPHNFEMPQKYIDAMTARMGREHSQETFETEKTALVVVDMQNYFMDESQQAGCPVGQTVVGNVNRIAETVRRTGGIVIWIQNLAPADTDETWKTAHERYLPEKAELRVASIMQLPEENAERLRVSLAILLEDAEPAVRTAARQRLLIFDEASGEEAFLGVLGSGNTEERKVFLGISKGCFGGHFPLFERFSIKVLH